MGTSKRNLILKAYIKLIKNTGNVKMKDLKSEGISKDMVAHHFGSLGSLDSEARKKSPEVFKNIAIEALYSKEALSGLRKDVTKSNKFIITTAVNGKEVDLNFYESIKVYCKENDAKLLILVSSDPASSLASHGKRWGTISAVLEDETIVLEDTKLNNNVFLSTIKLSAKHIDPTTGLARIGQRHGTCIYASPKQRLKAIPVANGKLPHFMMTTGAITKPNYDSDLYMSQRTAYIAENDHVMGAIIVEIDDTEIFHFRQVQANADGCFIDLGIQYCPKFTKKVRPEAFVLGDWHSGETDIDAANSWFEVIDTLQPKRVILHDAFNGLSVNHHENGKTLLKARRFENNQLSLHQELSDLADDLKTFIETRPFIEELTIVKSNHDAFIDRYLQDATYVYDPQNHRLALELAIALLDGKDPLKEGIRRFFVGQEELFNRIKWLKIEDDYKVEGVQCGAHGHLGSNGAKASILSTESTYGNSITGHTHTPEILRGAWTVGTSSRLRLDYNKGGASSWMLTSCLLYTGGSRQLINVIEGAWRKLYE
jgi:hypothetical protein